MAKSVFVLLIGDTDGKPVDLYQVEVTVNWDNTTSTPRTLRFVTLRAAPRP